MGEYWFGDGTCWLADIRMVHINGTRLLLYELV